MTNSGPHHSVMGKRELRQMLTAILRTSGQVSGGPSDVSPHDFARMRAPISPPPARKWGRAIMPRPAYPSPSVEIPLASFIDSRLLNLVPIDAGLARAHEGGAVFDAGDQAKGSQVHDLSPFRHSIQECPTSAPHPAIVCSSRLLGLSGWDRHDPSLSLPMQRGDNGGCGTY
jgi:hypothetical protein